MKIKLAVIVAVLDLVPVLFLVLGLALLWLWQFQKDMEAIAEAAIAAFGPLHGIAGSVMHRRMKTSKIGAT